MPPSVALVTLRRIIGPCPSKLGWPIRKHKRSLQDCHKLEWKLALIVT